MGTTKDALPEQAGNAGDGARSMDSMRTDLKYRFPGRYLASWAALALLVVVVAIVAPSALGGNSIRIVGALAGVLALASFGQMLVVMLGAIDLSVPAILAASAGITVHFGVEGANLPLVIAGLSRR